MSENLSSFGIPLYDARPVEPGYNLAKGFGRLSDSIRKKDFITAKGKPCINQVSGLLDVVEQFAKKIENSDFLNSYIELAKTFEAFKKKPTQLKKLESQLANLGKVTAEIPHKLCTDICLGLIENFDLELQNPDVEKHDMVGQLKTVAMLIDASEKINDHTKVEAHKLASFATQWSQDELDIEDLHLSIDLLVHDLSLLI